MNICNVVIYYLSREEFERHGMITEDNEQKQIWQHKVTDKMTEKRSEVKRWALTDHPSEELYVTYTLNWSVTPW